MIIVGTLHYCLRNKIIHSPVFSEDILLELQELHYTRSNREPVGHGDRSRSWQSRSTSLTSSAHLTERNRTGHCSFTAISIVLFLYLSDTFSQRYPCPLHRQELFVLSPVYSRIHTESPHNKSVLNNGGNYMNRAYIVIFFSHPFGFPS
jgi:hypothetical protein